MDGDTWNPPRWVRALCILLPVLALGYGVTLLPGVRGPHPEFSLWLEFGVGDGVIALSSLLCLARALLVRRARTAWLVLGLGALSYGTGDAYYCRFIAGAAHEPFPSPADAAWLATYPLLNAGLVLLVRSHLRGVRPSLWLDGLTGGFGAAALLGAVVLRPVLEATGGSLPVVLVNLA